jgi:hypothetical protein
MYQMFDRPTQARKNVLNNIRTIFQHAIASPAKMNPFSKYVAGLHSLQKFIHSLQNGAPAELGAEPAGRQLHRLRAQRSGAGRGAERQGAQLRQSGADSHRSSAPTPSSVSSSSPTPSESAPFRSVPGQGALLKER